jgi:hypothetical protein
VGWEYVHVAIDDASRVAFTQIVLDEKEQSAIAFLKAAVAYYASLGITVARLMTTMATAISRSTLQSPRWRSGSPRGRTARPIRVADHAAWLKIGGTLETRFCSSGLLFIDQQEVLPSSRRD